MEKKIEELKKQLEETVAQRSQGCLVIELPSSGSKIFFEKPATEVKSMDRRDLLNRLYITFDSDEGLKNAIDLLLHEWKSAGAESEGRTVVPPLNVMDYLVQYYRTKNEVQATADQIIAQHKMLFPFLNHIRW